MIDPSGQFAFVANQDSDNVVLFNIVDEGNLIQSDKSISIPSPVCVEYLRLK